MRNVEGVYQRGAVWWICYSVRGKRQRESADEVLRVIAPHHATHGQAVKLRKARIAESQNGRPVGAQVERTTLKDLCQMLEKDYRANGRKSTNRAKVAITRLSEFFGESARAVDITPDTITEYQANRRAQCYKGRPVANATINYEVAMLRRAFRLAARAGKVAFRPEIQLLHVENARKGFFEPEQYRAVVNHLPDYLKPVASVAYITGWRTKSELLSRQWRHVDLNAGWLRLEPGETKNGEGRMFPLTPELRAVLETQRRFVRGIEQSTGAIVPWVFIHDDGTPIRSFRHAWAKACAAAGLGTEIVKRVGRARRKVYVTDRLVHDFRRTAVRNLERAGVPRSAAMKITGHKTETIYRRYAIVDEGMMREAAEKLSALHAGEKSIPRKFTSMSEGL